MDKQAVLYLVSVPVGNLKDITLRALEVLQDVDYIAAEDTRYSLKLLNHYKIKKKLLSYYKPREREKSEVIIKLLRAKYKVALITDSGTPVISDPGYLLVKRAIEEQILVIPIPGPSALLPALITSGFSCEKFLFIGFLPKKPGALQRELNKLAECPHTMVFYESPKRINNLLKFAFIELGARRFCISKEITKKNEKFIRGNLKSFQEDLETEKILGEIVLVIEGLCDKKVPQNGLKIESMDDIYNYFKETHQISKNVIKDIIQKKR